MSKRTGQRLRKVEKCPECGGKQRRRTVDRYHYLESGLPNVYLRHITEYVCNDCGETVVSLPNIEQLHDRIFKKVLMKPSPLSGGELRFLRKYMGLKATDFAKMLDVDPTTLSKWENDQTTVGAQSDKLIRLSVGLTMTGEVKKAVEEAYRQFADRYLDFLNQVKNLKTTDEESPTQMTFDITAKEARESSLSFRWGVNRAPAVELAGH